ncbi:MAG: O-antigen ligase family protein [Caldilineaceae bacterium]
MHSIASIRPRQLDFARATQITLLALVALPLAFLPLSAIALLAAGGAAVILLLRWPWLIWLGVAAALPFTSSVKLGPVSLTDMGLVGAILLWFVDGVRRRTLRLHGSPILTALCAYIGALLCAALNAQNLGEAAAEVVKWVQVLTLILLIRQMVPKEQAAWLTAAIVAGGAAQALLGIYQFVFRIGPEWFAILGRFMRASGSFSQPNPFAGYLGLILPVPVSLCLWALGQVRRSSPWRRRWQMMLVVLLSGGAAGLVAAGLLASWSRGGWLGAAAAMIAVVGLRSRRSIAILLTTVLAAAVILLAGVNLAAAFAHNAAGESAANSPLTAISARFANVSAYFGLHQGGLEAALKEPVNDDNFAIIERLAHWSAALRMWSQAPWFGVGPGNYAVLYPAIIEQDTQLLRWPDPLGHAHNIYLNVLAESGLMGLAGYLLFWLVVVGWLWRKSRARTPKQAHHNGWNQALALGVIGIVVHLSVHNVVDNLFVQGNYLLIGFWLALIEITDNAA